MSRLVIPGLVDMLTVSDAAQIAALVDDRRMNRGYQSRGPLLNRTIFGRVAKVLRVGGQPLTPVAAREDATREAAQAENERRFGTIGTTVDPAGAAALARWVRGEGGANAVGPLAQAAVGTLFLPTYRADAKSWAAARVLGAAPSNFNPARALLWGLTGRVAKARELLVERADGDLSLVHGTGIAIHNIVDALRRMRALYADPAVRPALSPEAAVGQTLVAPKQVLRQPSASGESAAGRFTRNTLVRLRLQDANARDPGYDTAFMAGHWCECPARRWVPALLAAVWREAVTER
jgi:hypothetical protein